MAPTPCWLGLDIGTSGCRALAIDRAGTVRADARTPLPAPQQSADGGVEQDPALWWDAVRELLGALAAQLGDHDPRALCLDGTSATLLLAAPDGRPLTPGLMYNDSRARAEAERIAAAAPPDAAVHGAASSLAKLLLLAGRARHSAGALALHQADWIGGRLRGRYGDSDWNNALKLGFDPAAERWPDWLERLLPPGVRLPRCHAPGSELGSLDPEVAAATGLPPTLRVLAGTTDSTAGALAAGVAAPGDAVTSLGSTLVLKLVTARPVAESASGVYSHRIGDLWLAGGASNSGGAVLRQYFDDQALAELSERIDPAQPSGLDYYPLVRPGERFPHADPGQAPRLEPRPSDPARFLAGLFEGMARIERDGYRRLEALGASPPQRVLTVGGGARNRQWAAIRQRVLGLPVAAAIRQDAAYGAALLAQRATAPAGGRDGDD